MKIKWFYQSVRKFDHCQLTPITPKKASELREERPHTS
jgi:hypothetical protein